MRKFVLASHHRMAEGLKDTLEFILHAQNRVVALSAYTTEKDDLEQKIAAFFAACTDRDEVIVMCDLLSGSVAQKFYPYLGEHVHLLAGVNLPLAMILLLEDEEQYLTPERIQQALVEARQSLVYVNQLPLDNAEDE